VENSVSPPFTERWARFEVQVLKRPLLNLNNLPHRSIRSSSVELGFGIQTGIFESVAKIVIPPEPQSLSQF